MSYVDDYTEDFILYMYMYKSHNAMLTILSYQWVIYKYNICIQYFDTLGTPITIIYPDNNELILLIVALQVHIGNM